MAERNVGRSDRATFIFQIIFYFGGLYEKQVRLGQRMWFSQVAVMTFIGLLHRAFTLPTGRYPIPRANLLPWVY